jgi:hypothetical protein
MSVASGYARQVGFDWPKYLENTSTNRVRKVFDMRVVIWREKVVLGRMCLSILVGAQ